MKTPSQKKKLLFILKQRQVSGGLGKELKSAGLSNSANYVADMMNRHGFTAKVVQVVDNNSINKEVTEFTPDIVIIEALWVVPSKLEILQKLHPTVKWIVRLHSELSFLANEGIAFDWINQLIKIENVYLSTNSPNAQKDLSNYLGAQRLHHKLIYLPNYYPVLHKITPPKFFWNVGQTINIGCFGAIRSLKNQLIQAAAAVEFAEQRGLRCRFHINSSRVENNSDPVLKNIRAFFAGLDGIHELVEHDWLDRNEFLALVRTMDIGLQLSFSETFNIVAADFVNEDIPIVTSSEVNWMPMFFTAKPTNTTSIINAMRRVLFYDRNFSWLECQRRALKKYVNKSEYIWVTSMNTM